MKIKRNNYLKQGAGRVRSWPRGGPFIDLLLPLLPLHQLMKRVHLYMCKKILVYNFTKRNIYLITIRSNLLVKSCQHQNLLWWRMHSIVHIFQSWILFFGGPCDFQRRFLEGPCSSSINSMSHLANYVSLAPLDIVKFLCSSISSW
jgi:hypothetical protein